MNITGKSIADIVASIRQLVQSGQLEEGALLPPIRELAEQLGVNRNTVAAAYQRLVSAGLAVSQGRRGTMIRTQAEGGFQEGAMPDSPLTDLASGNPALHWLPDISRYLAQLPARTPRLYGEPLLNPELAALAQSRLFADQAEADALVLSHGAVDAVERLLLAHLKPGDKVIVEDPCFLGTINTLNQAGLEAVAVSVDAEGLQTEALAAALATGVQALICTPRGHNPTGCSLSQTRTTEIRSLLGQYPDVLLIEDDHFATVAGSAYYSIMPAGHRHHALVRSVSKGYGPDLRCAFIHSDAQTRERLLLRLTPGSNWVSHLLQDLLSLLLASDEVQQQLTQAADYYRAQHSALAAALNAAELPGLPVLSAPADGLNFWLPLPGLDAEQISHRLARYGWLVRDAAVFSVRQPQSALRITISELDGEQQQKLIADLRKCL